MKAKVMRSEYLQLLAFYVPNNTLTFQDIIIPILLSSFVSFHFVSQFLRDPDWQVIKRRRWRPGISTCHFDSEQANGKQGPGNGHAADAGYM